MLRKQCSTTIICNIRNMHYEKVNEWYGHARRDNMSDNANTSEQIFYENWLDYPYCDKGYLDAIILNILVKISINDKTSLRTSWSILKKCNFSWTLTFVLSPTAFSECVINGVAQEWYWGAVAISGLQGELWCWFLGTRCISIRTTLCTFCLTTICNSWVVSVTPL